MRSKTSSIANQQHCPSARSSTSCWIRQQQLSQDWTNWLLFGKQAIQLRSTLSTVQMQLIRNPLCVLMFTSRIECTAYTRSHRLVEQLTIEHRQQRIEYLVGFDTKEGRRWLRHYTPLSSIKIAPILRRRLQSVRKWLHLQLKHLLCSFLPWSIVLKWLQGWAMRMK